jgi:hypothetical protein
VGARDAILLVAVGEVVAGVDLEALATDQVSVDWSKKSVSVRLPSPEVFLVALDNASTHVYSRKTDVLASRNEQLEGKAREAAEASMRSSALDAGIVDKARAGAVTAVSALLRALGFTAIDVTCE